MIEARQPGEHQDYMVYDGDTPLCKVSTVWSKTGKGKATYSGPDWPATKARAEHIAQALRGRGACVMSNSPAPNIPANASTFTADVGSVSVYRDGGLICLVSVYPGGTYSLRMDREGALVLSSALLANATATAKEPPCST